MRFLQIPFSGLVIAIPAWHQDPLMMYSVERSWNGSECMDQAAMALVASAFLGSVEEESSLSTSLISLKRYDGRIRRRHPTRDRP